MKSSSLENKTVRPGLLAYSFYRSDRQPVRRSPTTPAKPKHRHGHAVVSLLILMVVVFGVFAGFRTYKAHQQQTPSSPAAATQAAAVAEGPQECNSNDLSQQIIVSISKRHLWACQYHKVAYNSPVVTGMEFIPSDKTPRGTYHIYAKQTDTVLTGTDSTGTWRDPVSYWMPFLDNQYGTFGFHDATWRPASDFGNIDPNTPKASHGCVNLSLATAKWLYSWAPVGTTVTIKS